MFDVVCISIFDVVFISVLMLNISLRLGDPNTYFYDVFFLAIKWVENGIYRNVFFFTMGLIKSAPGRCILYYYFRHEGIKYLNNL